MKKKTDILDSFWKPIKALLILILILAFLSDISVFYFLQTFGVSTGDNDILTISVFSNIPNIGEGDYAHYYREDGDGIIHRVKKIRKDYVIFESVFGKRDKVLKENIRGKMILDIPIIRLDEGMEGFLTACHYENYIGGYKQECNYLYYCKIMKTDMEECEK